MINYNYLRIKLGFHSKEDLRVDFQRIFETLTNKDFGTKKD